MKIIVGSNMNLWLFRRPGALDNRLAYLAGLAELGHEVYWFGHIEWPHLRNDQGESVRFRDWVVPDLFEEFTRREGIWPRCSLIYGRGEVTRGLSLDDAAAVARQADLLVNISGRLTLDLLFDPIPCRVYIDLDPGFTHHRQARGELDEKFTDHHYYFSVGTTIDRDEEIVPLAGQTWHPLMPPVNLNRWPARIDPAARRFTSVSSWKPIHFTHQGKRDGGKLAAWQQMVDLAAQTPQELELALMIAPEHAAQLDELRARRWLIRDGRELDTIDRYREFIAGSRGEFSVAKASYVQLPTGWFSDRSARYLASGKPVLLQSTGLAESLTGPHGVVTFHTVSEAVARLEEINADYEAYCRGARRLAEIYFDANRVLTQLLHIAGGG